MLNRENYLFVVSYFGSREVQLVNWPMTSCTCFLL